MFVVRDGRICEGEHTLYTRGPPLLGKTHLTASNGREGCYTDPLGTVGGINNRVSAASLPDISCRFGADIADAKLNEMNGFFRPPLCKL